MNIRNYGLSMAFLAAVVVPWVTAGCDQPVTQCQVGHATSYAYAATYKLVSSSGDCSAVPAVKGEQVGFDDYYPVVGQTRDFTKSTVYIQVGSVYDIQQNADNCLSPADPSTGYKGGNYSDTKDTTWSVAKFKDVLPDANDFCYLTDVTTAAQHIPAVPATKAGSNPPAACFSPGGACDNGDGTSNSSCVCPAPKPGMPPADNCCDKFFKYCADSSFAPCMGDGDCANGVKCSDTPVKVCGAPDPNTGLAVGCTGDAECAATGAKCTTATSASFCVNAPAVIGCGSDDDCCAAGDSKCLGKPHTCLPGGVDLTSCHTAQIPATDVSIAWSNVKFYNTAAAPGTQMTATQDRTTGTCHQTYQVIGVWPAVSCDDGTGKPFPAACCPGADPADGLPLGSGINPDFQVKCDPDILLCVLDISQTESDGKTPKIPQLDSNGYPNGCPAPKPVPGAE